MNSNCINWGILGAARINQQLMPALIQAANGRLIAIASQRPGAAQETLNLYGPEQKDVKIYSSYAELLQDDEIDAVYIPLASQHHAEWVLKAIDSGKHVLCEKPLALTVSDIEQIQGAALQNKVLVTEGFMYRHHPQHQKVQEWIHQDLIGEIRAVRTCFSYLMQPARLYRVANPIENGGGAMWDIGCYAIHTARYLFGESQPHAVMAMAKHNDHQADISCTGLIDFGDGKYAQISFGYEHARRAEYEIIGTKGGIKCHNVWAKANETPILSWWTEKGDAKTIEFPLANHFVLEVEHFNDCILKQQSPLLSLNDAKDNCALILACLESIKQQRQIIA